MPPIPLHSSWDVVVDAGGGSGGTSIGAASAFLRC